MCFRRDLRLVMLKSDGNREDIDRVYSSKLSPAELEVIFQEPIAA